MVEEMLPCLIVAGFQKSVNSDSAKSPDVFPQSQMDLLCNPLFQLAAAQQEAK
jgi:hypothetical protein